jgi:hypothetical protein
LVVANIVFTKVHIEVMMIESKNAKCREECKTRDQTRAIMKSHGYRRYENVVVRTDLYIHRASLLKLPTSAVEAE